MKMKIKTQLKGSVWIATVPGLGPTCTGRATTLERAVACAVRNALDEMAQRADKGTRSMSGGSLSLEQWVKDALFVVVPDSGVVED